MAVSTLPGLGVVLDEDYLRATRADGEPWFERYFDVVGHYARPDIFQLLVDESSRTPVTFHNARTPISATGFRDVDRRAPRPAPNGPPRIDPVR